jgi:hypothetical protein
MKPAARQDLNNLEVTFHFLDFNFIDPYIDFVQRRPTAPPSRMTTELAPPRPAWAAALDDDDWQFIRRFVLASGSLKAMAEQYGVSYPTVRSRLDRLIAKVRAAESPMPRDPLERKLRMLVADGQLAPVLARELLAAHQESLKGRTK